MTTIEWAESGIDWLSCSLRLDATNVAQWRHQCTWCIEGIAREGHQVVPRKLNGYHGVSVGNCFIGEREDGYWFNLTGEYANRYFHHTYHPEAHYSRIDAQITVKYTEPRPDIGKDAYYAASHHNDRLSAAKRRKLYIIIGSDGGDTLYIGAPSSDQRGRMYNKEVQSQIERYRGCWRWEVVFKNDLATDYAAQLASRPDRASKHVFGTVAAWYGDRGVILPGMHDMGAVILPKQRAVSTDVERKLQWLERQVAPTVRYLCELGFRDTIAAALGLNEP